MIKRLSLRIGFCLLALASFGLVAAGVVMGEMLRLQACPLCIFQRVLYLGVGGFALAGAVLPAGRLLWLVPAGGIALWGAGVAGYQSWLQAFPDPSLECNYADPNLIERLVDWLGQQSPMLFMATGFCSSREWEFLGMSMANWSVVCFMALLAWIVLLVRHRG